MKLEKGIYALKSQVVKHRRWLHKHPEIGFHLERTKEYILCQLKNWDFDKLEILAGCGIKAVMKSPKSKGCFAFRADMDALSLHEKTGLGFASVRPGYMHGCGHDGHMAILLGFAQWLHENKKDIQRDVVLIFQPAEESEGGALPMIEEGVLDDPGVDAVFGLHIFPEIEQGTLGLRPGPLMAQTCEFDIEISGKNAHGAMPHKGVDALLAACGLVQDMQSIISRMVNPFDNVVISIGRLEAGERRNIVAENARLEGIIRTFDDIVYQDIKKILLNLIEGMEKSWGVKGSFKEVVYYPVVYNDICLTKKVERILDKGVVKKIEPVMIAEDFSYYQQRVPGVYIFLGSGNRDKGYTHPLHSSRFDFDEDILLQGIQLYWDILQNIEI